MVISFCRVNMQTPAKIPRTPQAPKKKRPTRSRIFLAEEMADLQMGTTNNNTTPTTTPKKRLLPRGFWTARTNLEREVFKPLMWSTPKKKQESLETSVEDIFA